MLISGWRLVELACVNPETEATCAHCGQSAWAGHVMQRYIHIFWIPIFPFAKRVEFECEHCRKAYRKKEVPAPLMRLVDQIKAEVRTPRRYFTGLFALGGLFVLPWILGLVFFLCGINPSRADRELIAKPAVGDIYLVKRLEGAHPAPDASPYQVLRITAVDDSKVSFAVSAETYRRLNQARRAAESDAVTDPEFFREARLLTERAKLMGWYDETVIFDVLRAEEVASTSGAAGSRASAQAGGAGGEPR
jgi:hypothetical protein